MQGRGLDIELTFDGVLGLPFACPCGKRQRAKEVGEVVRKQVAVGSRP